MKSLFKCNPFLNFQERCDEFQASLTLPLSDYIREMSKPGVCADNQALQCLGEMLNCQLRILQTGCQDLYISQVDSSTVLNLGYLADVEHYVSVVTLSVQKDKYFVVLYTEPVTFYVGRIVNMNCSCSTLSVTHLSMMFLKQNFFSGEFDWPKSKRTPECVLSM